MNRMQKILIGALVLQLALTAVVFWSQIAPASAAGAAPLLGEMKVNDINGLTITGPDGKSTHLVRQGDAWVLATAGDYPADAAKITPFLDKLVAIKNNRLVTRTAASHARLKVSEGDFNSKIELQTASGSPQTLLVGTTAGGNTTHVRLSGQAEVYLAGNFNTSDVNPEPSAWIDTTYVQVEQANVTALAVKNAKGGFVFTKDPTGKWAMAELGAGEQTNESAVTTITGGLAPLRMTRPLGKTADPSWGMDKPLASVTLKYTQDNQEKSVNYAVGAKLPDGNYVVKSDTSEYYVAVAEYVVKDVVEKDRAGFITVPTPAAAPAPAGTPAP